MKKVSVLMPVYKTKKKYLKENINSILNQSYQNFELIILNDSPDDLNIEKVVKSYQDSRIRFYTNHVNLGISESRNKLINLAQGEYLAIVDHDDISLPDRLKKQVAFLDANHAVGVVSSFACKINKHGEPRKFKNFLGYYEIINDDAIKLGLVKKCVVIHPAAMIRKSILTDNNIYYEKQFFPAEDYALWCRLINITKFHNLSEVLLHYRRYSGNTIKFNQNKLKNSVLKIHYFLAKNNPDLIAKYYMKNFKITSFYLFGFLPLLKIKQKPGLIKIYLLNILILQSIRNC